LQPVSEQVRLVNIKTHSTGDAPDHSATVTPQRKQPCTRHTPATPEGAC
jgi:hypothetical protein